MRSALVYLLFILFASTLDANASSDSIPQWMRVNSAHLDHLYEEILLEGNTRVGIIHIYCEYPDYKWVGDHDEGIACVDDVARAAVFYLRDWELQLDNESLRKAEMLLRFIVEMQADSGYFYNFVWPDHNIHREGITTRAEPNWWSWRALWALSEGIRTEGVDTELLKELRQSRQRLVDVMCNEPVQIDSYKDVAGLRIPQWLPAGSATDQAALIIMGLAPYYQETSDTRALRLIKSMADGMVELQIRADGEWFDGMIMSWENIWHAYACLQSYALIIASEVSGDERYLDAATHEVGSFYRELAERHYMHSFTLQYIGDSYTTGDQRKFEQIAYGIRPAVWACLELYKSKGDLQYLKLGHQMAAWFSDANLAGQAMYIPHNGMGLDGIIDFNKVNRNAGAESTIEALLCLQAFEYMEKMDNRR